MNYTAIIETKKINNVVFDPNTKHNVFMGFDWSKAPIGICRVKKHNGGLLGEFVLMEECYGLYPSIVTNENKLFAISVHKTPNNDKTIMPLGYSGRINDILDSIKKTNRSYLMTILDLVEANYLERIGVQMSREHGIYKIDVNKSRAILTI